MSTAPLTVDDRPLRLRPRDGAPRCVVEAIAQWAWRNRVTLMLAYISALVTVGALSQLGYL